MIVDMNIELAMENGSIATVRCARCHEELGRVQVRGPTRGEAPTIWEDEVRGEMEFLAHQQGPALPGSPPHAAEPVATDFGEHREKP